MFGSKNVHKIPMLNNIEPTMMIFLFSSGFFTKMFPIKYEKTAATPKGMNKKYPAVTYENWNLLTNVSFKLSM